MLFAFWCLRVCSWPWTSGALGVRLWGALRALKKSTHTLKRIGVPILVDIEPRFVLMSQGGACRSFTETAECAAVRYAVALLVIDVADRVAFAEVIQFTGLPVFAVSTSYCATVLATLRQQATFMVSTWLGQRATHQSFPTEAMLNAMRLHITFFVSFASTNTKCFWRIT